MSPRGAGEDAAAEALRGQRQRKTRDAALILPVGGAILLMPPVARIFAEDLPVFGVPLVVAYVFGVWAFLIASAWLIARRLAPRPED